MNNQYRMKPREHSDIVRRGYDKLSTAYRKDSTSDDYGEYAVWIENLSGHLAPGASVLDVGCGCGLPATRLLARRFTVTGVDFSATQIKRARRLVPEARFLRDDITDLVFSPANFDAVVSFYTIIHIPLEEHEPLFHRIFTWLKPSGYLLATVGHEAWSGTEEAYLGVEGGKMCWSHAGEETYIKWIEEAGFKVRWTEFIPEGDSGHTLLFAQKPPI